MWTYLHSTTSIQSSLVALDLVDFRQFSGHEHYILSSYEVLAKPVPCCWKKKINIVRIVNACNEIQTWVWQPLFFVWMVVFLVSALVSPTPSLTNFLIKFQNTHKSLEISFIHIKIMDWMLATVQKSNIPNDNTHLSNQHMSRCVRVVLPT